MPEESKDNVNKVIMLLLAALMSVTIQGMVTRGNKITNSASKEDLKKVKTEMEHYTDKSIVECKRETREMIKAVTDVNAATVEGIKTDIKDLKEGQGTILDYILNQKGNK